jgi:hypothetical protein
MNREQGLRILSQLQSSDTLPSYPLSVCGDGDNCIFAKALSCRPTNDDKIHMTCHALQALSFKKRCVLHSEFFMGKFAKDGFSLDLPKALTWDAILARLRDDKRWCLYCLQHKVHHLDCPKAPSWDL